MMGHKKKALDASVNAFLNGLEDPVEAAQAIVPGIISFLVKLSSVPWIMRLQDDVMF
jgi:hypothetical protein